MGIRVFTFSVSIVFSIAIAWDRLAPVYFTRSIERVHLEDSKMGQSVSMWEYGIKDGMKIGHRLVHDLIGEAFEKGMRVRLFPHPATGGEILEVTPNKMVSIGRTYYFITEKSLPGDPAPNRVPYSTALYALEDPAKRTLKTWAEEKRFQASPEGREKLEKEKELIKTQFLHAVAKAIEKRDEAVKKLEILGQNFTTITGHEFTTENYHAYAKGTLGPAPSDGDALDPSDGGDGDASDGDALDGDASEKKTKSAPKRARTRTQKKT